MAFARAVGEIGAIVLITGQPAVQDRGRVGLHLQPDRERRLRTGRRRSRSCCSDLLRRAARGRRHPPVRHEARACVASSRSASSRSATSAVILLAPLAMMFWRTFAGHRRRLGRDQRPDTIIAFKLTLIVTAIAVPLNTVFGIVCGLAIVRRTVPRQGARERVRRPAARALARRRRPLALPALRAQRLVRALPARPRLPGAVRAAVDRARDDLRLAAVRRARGRPDAARDRRRAGAGGAHARRVGLADVLADHAAVDPLGGHLRGRAHDGALPRRVRRGRGRLREHRGQDADRDAARGGRLPVRERETTPPPTASRSCSPRSRSSSSSRCS